MEPRPTGESRNPIEDKRAIHEKGESEQLEKFEVFPPEREGNEPDDDGAAGIDG